MSRRTKADTDIPSAATRRRSVPTSFASKSTSMLRRSRNSDGRPRFLGAMSRRTFYFCSGTKASGPCGRPRWAGGMSSPKAAPCCAGEASSAFKLDDGRPPEAAVMSQEMAEGRFDYLRWFPEGSKAHLFHQKASPVKVAPKNLTRYVADVWLPRKTPPNVRASLEITYRKHWRKHIEPPFGGLPLVAITTAALVDFKTTLTAAEPKGKGLKMKTARDVIDGTFRAIYRDARTVDHFVMDDPFAGVTWPRKVDPEPDPFTAEERDLVLDFFWRRKRHYYPLVYTLFFTGLRTGEAVGLRWGAVNLRRSTLSVRVSRTLGEDNPPKTRRARARSRCAPMWWPCSGQSSRSGARRTPSFSPARRATRWTKSASLTTTGALPCVRRASRRGSSTRPGTPSSPRRLKPAW